MNELDRKNKRVALIVLAVVAGMIGLAYASVPLYRLFCQITGYGGTTQISAAGPEKIVDRTIRITFDARVDASLPWDFKPEVRHVDVKVGQKGLVSYVAVNESSARTVGMSVYNVTPDKAGKYFHKTQCFCFAEQALDGGKTTHFPVVFYVDPSIMDDPLMDDVTDITLSYTFYAAESTALDDAISNYGQEGR